MKHLVVSKALALILVFAMLFELMPANGFATPGDEAGSQSVQQQEELLVKEEGLETDGENENSSAESETETKALIVGEVSELREEGIKHFRMDDGSFIAVDYGMPVHFTADNGDTWENIDNTLVLQSAEKSAESQDDGDAFEPAIEIEQKYTAENGDNKISFANTLQNGFLFSSESGEYRVSISLPIGDNSANNSEKTDNSIEEIGAENTSNTNPAESGGGSETELDPNAELIEQPGEGAVTGTAPLDNPETQGEGFLVEASSEAESEAETADEPMIAETPLPEMFNSLAVAEVSYPQEQIAQTDRGDTEDNNQAKKIECSLAEQVMPSRLCASVLYRNVYDNVDISYNVCAFNVKESIIINNFRENYAFSFALDVGDLKPTLQEDGSITLSDEADQCIYLIPAPYMYDAAYDYSDAVAYSLTKNEQGVWTLTVTADADWINAEERVFPVTIDPTLEYKASASYKSIITSYVRSDYPNTPPTDNTTYVDVGTTSSSVHRKGFVYIKDIPTLTKGAILTDSYLCMYNAHGPTNEQYVYLYSSTSTAANSNPESFLNTATWNSVQSIPYGGSTSSTGRKALDYAKIASNEIGWCSWNITGLMQSWYDGSGPSRLLVLEGAINTGSPYVYFHGYKSYSDDRPTLIIHYQNAVGIEDCYSYQSQGIGLAGAGSVNNYTLGLTISNTLVSFPSTVLPFSFGLVYNSARAEDACTESSNYITRKYSGHVGQGWKMNIQQTVYSLRIDEGDGNNAFYLVYMDADGTEHYFKYDEEKASYCDEDGLNLSITIAEESDQTIYTMKDDSENTWEFYNGFLTTFTDNNGNKLFYGYDDHSYSDQNEIWKPSVNAGTHKITGVWRQNDGCSVETLLALGYYDNGCLKTITARGGKQISFTYGYRTVNGEARYYLSEISYPVDRKALYNYVNYTANSVTCRLLTEAYDAEANYGIQYSYQWTLGDFRTKNIFEHQLQNGSVKTRNKMRLFKTGSHHTSCRFFGDDMKSSGTGQQSSETADDIVSVYNFDDYGRMTSTFSKDDKGNILGSATADYTKKEGTKPDNNRLTHQAAQGKSSCNLLNNGGIESSAEGDQWNYLEYYGNYADGIRANDLDSPSHLQSGIHPHHGHYVLKTFVDSSSVAAASRAVFFRKVHLNENTTYTLSAYINTNKITDFRNKGVGVFFANVLPDGSTAPLAVQTISTIDYNTIATESGWERLSVSFTPENGGDYWVGVIQDGAAGCAYYDDIQLEESETASAVNLLSCGSFESSNYYSYWTRSDTTFVSRVNGSTDYVDGSYGLMIQGVPSAVRKASQSISINKSAKSTFILSGWGKAESAPNAHNEDLTSWKPFFGLIASIVYANSTEPAEQHRIPFASNTTGWQYVSGVIVPKHPEWTIDRIDVFVSYHNNINTAYFDNICLTQEPVQTYSYDTENGKLLSSTQTDNDETTYQYDDDHRLTQYKSLTGVTYTLGYTGDSRNPTTEAYDGLTATYQYDEAGNTKKTTITGTGTSYYLENTADYQISYYNRNFQTKATDTLGAEATYSYNINTGNMLTATVPVRQDESNNTVNVTTFYTYDSNTARINSTYQSGIANIDYYYNTDGQLNNLTRKTFRNGATFWQQYSWSYDDWGQQTGISVKLNKGSGLSTGISLATYSYNDDGSMNELDYSNGTRVLYTYDLLDRPVRKVYNVGNNSNAVADYRYVYDAQGNLAKQYAVNNGQISEEYQFEYDSLGRLIRSKELNNGSTVQRTEHLYDTANRVTERRWAVGSRSFSEEYTYNESTNDLATLNDGSLATMTTATGDKLFYYYDALKRPSTVYTKTSNGTTRFYTARNYKSNGLKSTNLISGFAYRKSNGNIINYNTYEYDIAGNITKINKLVQNGSQTQTQTLAEYEYDDQNQLVKETRGNTVCQYTYDTAGNILSASASDQDTITYTYDNDDWHDLLTEITKGSTTKKIAYEGQTYNATNNTVTGSPNSGNPINWYNGTLFTNLTWTQGRRLSSLTKKGAYGYQDQTISYTYDMEGIRSSKTVGNSVYRYTTQDGRVVREMHGGRVIDFIYDAAGQPYAMEYSDAGETPTTYYYVLNAQGDVVGLIDASGSYVATYTYDAWGKLLSSSGIMASTNPLRYRGYYYDEETGWYYLQSRYYDPVIKRFINYDNQIACSSFISLTLFSYCLNNPVNMVDPFGHMSKWISGILDIVGGALEIAAGAVLGAAASWTGIGAVAGAVLLADGAARVTQGTGKIVNSITQKPTMSEDNLLRAGVQTIGQAIAGNSGARVAGAAYDLTITAASAYGIASSIATRITSSPSPQSFSEFSTGRTTPHNLVEQLAMESAKSNPQAGSQIMTVFNDSRIPSGYYKYSQGFQTLFWNVQIHYLGNPETGHYFDFKFAYAEFTLFKKIME